MVGCVTGLQAILTRSASSPISSATRANHRWLTLTDSEEPLVRESKDGGSRDADHLRPCGTDADGLG